MISIAFKPDDDVHACLGTGGGGGGGIANLVNHPQVPQLQQGANAAVSKANLVTWLDSIVTAYAPKHVKPIIMATGLAVPGHYDGLQAHYDGLQAHEYTAYCYNCILH